VSPYKFVFGNDQYPYNPGNSTDYPSGGIVTKGPYKNGSLEIVLRFSEPMQIMSPDFHVNLNPPGGGSPIPFSASGGQNGWSNVNLPDLSAFDTWTGVVTPPGNMPSGTATVGVRARHQIVLPGLDVTNQELDTTGSGSSWTPASGGTEDTSISFLPEDPSSVVGNVAGDVFQRSSFASLKLLSFLRRSPDGEFAADETRRPPTAGLDCLAVFDSPPQRRAPGAAAESLIKQSRSRSALSTALRGRSEEVPMMATTERPERGGGIARA